MAELTADQPLVLMTVGGLQEVINEGVLTALRQLKREEDANKRLTSQEAAAFLGCTTNHLQKLHKQGLVYEKGKPNRYRLADLEKVEQQRQLDRTTY